MPKVPKSAKNIIGSTAITKIHFLKYISEFLSKILLLKFIYQNFVRGFKPFYPIENYFPNNENFLLYFYGLQIWIVNFYDAF